MFKHCLRLAAALALMLAGLLAGLLLPHLVGRGDTGGGDGGPGGRAAPIAHAHAGPTLEQVRALSALTVLEIDVADVQVTDLRGYTGGVRAALVVKGDVTLLTDLSRARFASRNPAARTAVLVLPPPQVGSPRVDHVRTRLVWVWEYGLWQVVPGDRAHAAVVNRALAEAQQVVAAAGRDPSLDGRARAQAEAALRALFEAVGWELDVRWSDHQPGRAPATAPAAATRPADMPVSHNKGGRRMASDQQVSARHVLQALTRLRRQGIERAMAELEQLEPDLAGYLMEELSLLHQKLLELGAPAGRTRWLVRRTESLVLVCVTALRQGHYDLWRQGPDVPAGADPAPPHLPDTPPLKPASGDGEADAAPRPPAIPPPRDGPEASLPPPDVG